MSKEGCLRRIARYRATGRESMAVAEEEFMAKTYGVTEEPKPKSKSK